jgi:hypothetical protein
VRYSYVPANQQVQRVEEILEALVRLSSAHRQDEPGLGLGG